MELQCEPNHRVYEYNFPLPWISIIYLFAGGLQVKTVNKAPCVDNNNYESDP